MINSVNNPKHITILGGGLAGLVAGYYANKHKISLTIYESNNHIGGASSTLEENDFHFDLGAHLFRDEDMEVTQELKELLGSDLMVITLPIQTYCKGKIVDFPFSPLNLLRNFGILSIVRAAIEILKQKIEDNKSYQNLETFVIKTYGKSLAKLLILDYSAKLWGKPCNELSPDVSGNKLRGLEFKTFLKEIVPHKIRNTKHSGTILYYPKKGIGMIAEKFSETFMDDIHINSEITKIFHDHNQIQMVEINNKEKVAVDQLLSTIPINIFLQIMDPRPPPEILNLANSLIFRDMILVILFLNKDSITESASIHFTDLEFPVTRIHEPKKRSEKMAPSRKTSLVAEIPCAQGNKIWNMEDQDIIHLVASRLFEIKWIGKKEIIDTLVFRLRYAYPVLDVDYKWKINKITTFLDNFSNLRIAGRNGTFTYISIHDIISSSKKIIEKYVS